MKRFVAIVTIAVLVLAMTAGTAFASVCVGTACGDVMVCAPTTSVSCPMDNGPSMAHSSCDHTAQVQSRDATPTDTGHATYMAVVHATPIPAAHLLGRLSLGARASDARGAPHLTAVLRI
jgi:hypothetical protein